MDPARDDRGNASLRAPDACAGEKHAPPGLIVTLPFEFYEYQTGTEYVAGDAKLRLNTFGDFDWFARVAYRVNQTQGPRCVLLRIQRQRG